MTPVKEVLLQLLFSLTPFVLFNIYYRDKDSNYSKGFVLISSCISLLLSMVFSSSVVPGVMFDVRYVILFFGMVFGGMLTGFVLLAEFLSIRLYMGGPGLLPGLVILAITFPLSIVLSLLYHRTDYKFTVTLIAGLCFSFIPAFVLSWMMPDYVEEHFVFNLVFVPTQNLLGSWLLVTLFHKAATDKELHLKYKQSEKIEAISHVAASLVHEVRNPLTTVLGFLKLIRENSSSKEKLDQFIDISMNEIKRTEHILSEYLSMSMSFTQHRETLNLTHELRTVVDVLTPYATMHNVTLSCLVPAEAITISANSAETKQMLVHFIKNAVEACADIPDRLVTVALTSELHVAHLQIKDNGKGMSSEQLKRLGSIHYSTKARGTGLGLTFSYKLIHSLNGKVSVSSTEHVGTEFHIQLPLARSSRTA